MHRLSREQARRICVGAQALGGSSWSKVDELVPLVERLTYLPVDQTARVAPAADLVAWGRLGDRYRPGDLDDALAARELIEWAGTIRPVADLPLLRPPMAAWPPWPDTRDWLDANELFAAEVLDELLDGGPLLSREIHASPQQPWRSSGWNENRSVALLLENLMMQGTVAVDGRRGNQRLWNLAERVYPPDPETVDADEAERRRDGRRLRALGLARASGTELPGESIHVRDAGEPAVVGGVPGEWRVDPAGVRALDDWSGRTVLLSPFDALVRDRKRMAELFDYTYVLEMYKPAAQRRWGYFALPILDGDRLVGKLDATADRKAGAFVVDAVHEDGSWSAARRRRVEAEIDSLADWLGLLRR